MRQNPLSLTVKSKIAPLSSRSKCRLGSGFFVNNYFNFGRYVPIPKFEQKMLVGVDLILGLHIRKSHRSVVVGLS